mmetsp:Transcript_59260/g.166851  ORF Transcript_59260/g.166851 Transcript_59260/m.166851 type:complete len:179 (+) Transcript_59260:142-678(+)
MSRGVPVRITQGIKPQHSRVGFVQVMSQFGEVVYCRKPPYSGIQGEDYVNIGFATQSAAEKAYEELKAGRLIVDGVVVGCGPMPKEEGTKETKALGNRSRSNSRGRSNGRSRRERQPKKEEPPVRATFKQRHDERSPSPRTIAREAMMKQKTRRRRSPSSSSSSSRSRSRSRRRGRKR